MIHEKIVLVTGATGGLGALEDRILAHPADLGDASQAAGLLDGIAERQEGVDVLVNLAGGRMGGKPLAEVTEQEWIAALGLNLRSVFLISRAVLPYMAKRRRGRIVNISSKAAESPGPRQAACNAANAGVIALTASSAAEYRRSGAAIPVYGGVWGSTLRS